MSWKEIYKPTIGKMIIPVAFFLFFTYQVIRNWGHYFMCQVDCASNISYSISSLVFALIVTMFLVYPIVCWTFALGDWIIGKFRK